MFEKRLRREILRVVADQAEKNSSLEIARIQFIKPKSR